MNVKYPRSTIGKRFYLPSFLCSNPWVMGFCGICGFAQFLEFLYLDIWEELHLHYFTQIYNYSPYIKTILLTNNLYFVQRTSYILHIWTSHFSLTSYVFVVSKKSVIYGNRFKLKTYKFSSVKNTAVIDK